MPLAAAWTFPAASITTSRPTKTTPEKCTNDDHLFGSCHVWDPCCAQRRPANEIPQPSTGGQMEHSWLDKEDRPPGWRNSLVENLALVQRPSLRWALDPPNRRRTVLPNWSFQEIHLEKHQHTNFHRQPTILCLPWPPWKDIAAVAQRHPLWHKDPWMKILWTAPPGWFGGLARNR